MRALLVECCPTSARTTAALLEANAVTADVAPAGERALDLARKAAYDALLLRLELPDLDGIEVLQRLRNTGISTPVLILSSLAQPSARVKALAAGADDVVTLPFDAEELLARVRAVVRRSRRLAESSITVGPLTLNTGTRDVTVNGTPVHLTGKELGILELLAQRRGSPVSKEGMLGHLYGGRDVPEMKIIDVFVCKLRRKLAEAGAENLIATVWGRGYAVRGDGQHLPPPDAPSTRKQVSAGSA